MASILMRATRLSSVGQHGAYMMRRHTGQSAQYVACSASSAPPAAARKLRVAHIMVPKDSAALLDDLEQQLAAGADFGDLAQRHSRCPSARRGGEVGWVSRGSMFPEFEEAAFSAGVGATTRASTVAGHHLIRVLDEKHEAEVQHMSVQELQDMLENPALAEDVQFVDVREESEFDVSRLPGFRLLPLSTASSWAPTIGETLDPDRETVVLCHHGVRSMQAAQFLVSRGFSNVKNVTGGIHAYSQVDPSVPMY